MRNVIMPLWSPSKNVDETLKRAEKEYLMHASYHKSTGLAFLFTVSLEAENIFGGKNLFFVCFAQ